MLATCTSLSYKWRFVFRSNLIHYLEEDVTNNAEFPDNGVFDLGLMPTRFVVSPWNSLRLMVQRTLCDLVFKFADLVCRVDGGNHGHGLAAIIFQVISPAQAMPCSGRSQSVNSV